MSHLLNIATFNYQLMGETQIKRRDTKEKGG